MCVAKSRFDKVVFTSAAMVVAKNLQARIVGGTRTGAKHWNVTWSSRALAIRKNANVAATSPGVASTAIPNVAGVAFSGPLMNFVRSITADHAVKRCTASTRLCTVKGLIVPRCETATSNACFVQSVVPQRGAVSMVILKYAGRAWRLKGMTSAPCDTVPSAARGGWMRAMIVRCTSIFVVVVPTSDLWPARSDLANGAVRTSGVALMEILSCVADANKRNALEAAGIVGTAAKASVAALFTLAVRRTPLMVVRNGEIIFAQRALAAYVVATVGNVFTQNVSQNPARVERMRSATI